MGGAAPAEETGTSGDSGAGHLAWLLAWFAALPVVVLRSGALAESDTFWQIRTGEVVLAGGGMPREDTFTWTAAGRAWTPNSWGFDVAAALVHRLAGLPGVAVGAAALAWVVLGLCLVLARELGAAAVVAGPMVLITAASLVGWLSARPQVADYAAVLALALLLRGSAQRGSIVQGVTAIALLVVVWANLHAAAIVAVPLIAAAALAVLVRGGGVRCAWPLGAAAAASALACLATPYGPELVRHAGAVQQSSSGTIEEWAGADLTDPVQLVALGLGLMAGILAVRRREAALAGMIGAAAVGLVLAVRMLPVLAFLGVPVLAAAASTPLALAYLRSRRRVLVPAAAAAWAVLAVMAAPSLGHVGRPDPALYPAEELTGAIPTACRTYTTYLVGGYLILVRPDAPVSIDSRNDLHGADAVARAERALAGAREADEDLHGAGCALVPSGSALAGHLARVSGWARLGQDGTFVLYARS